MPPPVILPGREFYDDGYYDDDRKGARDATPDSDDRDENDLADRLDFTKVQFHGRQRELQTLQHAYDRAMRPRQRPIAAIVSSYSGAGKSTLIRRFQSRLQQHASAPYFISGKFDQLQDADPFSAIVEAFADLVDCIVKRVDDQPQSMASTIRRIHQAIGDELAVLSSLIPNIAKLFESQPTAVQLQQQSQSQGDVNNNHSAHGAPAVHASNTPKHKESSNSLQNDANTSQRNEAKHAIDLSNRDAASTLDVSATTSTNNVPRQQGSKENAWNRLRYLFAAFLQALDHPLVLHMDDIQWMTQPTLDLLLSTILSPKASIHNCLFLASVRSDDPNHETILRKLMRTDEPDANASSQQLGQARQDDKKEQAGQPDSSHIVQIDLLNLSFEETGDLIADILSLTRTECESLTKAIYNKTRGNVFFTLQSLEELERIGVLFFSRMMFQWDWNIKSVAGLEAELSDNVLDAVMARIQCAPIKLQQILQLAAYTRNTIDVDTIRQLSSLAWDDDHAAASNSAPRNHESNASASPAALPSIDLQQEDELVKLLDLAVLERFLTNNVGSTIYRFAHDKVQQAACSLIPMGPQRDAFRVQLGRRLYMIGTNSGPPQMASSSNNNNDNQYQHFHQDTTDKDWCLFVASDHLNISREQLMRDEPLLLLDVNLRVGERASAVGAFDTAAKYLVHSLHVAKTLWPYTWGDNDEHYDLLLRLYRTAADVELWRGNFSEGYILCGEVMDHARCIDDRLPTNLTMGSSLGRQHKHKKAQQLYISCLREMDLYPRRMYALRLSRLHFASKRFFQTHTDDNILLMPQVQDPRLEIAMEVYLSAASQSYYCGEMMEYLMCSLQSLDILYRHGLTQHTAMSLSAYSLFLSQINEQEVATRVCDLSKKLLNASNAKHLEAKVLVSTTHMISAWKDPHADVLETYERGALAGFETGDFENGAMNKTARLHFAYSIGHSLSMLELAYSEVLEEMDYYCIDVVSRFSMAQFRIIQYLRGSGPTSQFPEDCSTIDWEVLARFGSQGTVAKGDTYVYIYEYTSRLELGVYYRNLEFALSMAKALKPLVTHDLGYISTVLRMFMGGLAHSGMFHATGQAKHRKKAKKISRSFQQMLRTRGANSQHRHALLEADINARITSNNTSTAEKAYDDAIQQAVRVGHVQDAALGSEVAGEFFLKHGHEELAARYLTQANYFYGEWGASGKVKHLAETRGAYIRSAITKNQITECTGYQFSNLRPDQRNSLRINTDTTSASISEMIHSNDSRTGSNGRSKGNSIDAEYFDSKAPGSVVIESKLEAKHSNPLPRDLDGISVLTDPTDHISTQASSNAVTATTSEAASLAATNDE